VHRFTQHPDAKPIRMVSDPGPPTKTTGIAASRRAQS
jgi:hypothetical protein